jgi:hypothetical protein
LLVLESQTHEFSIKSKAKSTFVHIEANTKDSLLLERFPVGCTYCITTVSQLTKAVVGEPKSVV